MYNRNSSAENIERIKKILAMNESHEEKPAKSEHQKNIEKEIARDSEREKNSIAYKKNKALKERTEFKTNLKSYLMESWLNYVFEAGLGNRKAIISEDTKALNKSLIKAFVTEEGVDFLLDRMSRKSNLLAEMAKYINEATDDAMKEYDANGTTSIDAELQDDMFNKLDGSQDFEDVSEVIRDRVSQATQNFIQKNMVDKLDIKEIMNDTKERINNIRSGNDETDEAIAHEQTVKMKNAVNKINKRPHSIYEQLVINLTESILANPKAKEKFTNEFGKLDMDAIVERSTSMYTMLEMVNTLRLRDLDEAYINDVISMK